MSANILNTLLLGSFFLVLFGFAEFLYHKLKVKPELTRKLVHLGTGLLTLLFPLWITNHWFILALCSSFLLILILSLKFNFLPSINNVNRKTQGSILYPIVVYCCFLVHLKFDSLIYFYLPILILAICDPIAALVGKKFPFGSYKTFGHTKTLTGSAGFYFSAFVVSVICMSSLMTISFSEVLVISLCIALLSSLSEAFSHRGFDNFTIPTSAILILILTLN